MPQYKMDILSLSPAERERREERERGEREERERGEREERKREEREREETEREKKEMEEEKKSIFSKCAPILRSLHPPSFANFSSNFFLPCL